MKDKRREVAVLHHALLAGKVIPAVDDEGVEDDLGDPLGVFAFDILQQVDDPHEASVVGIQSWHADAHRLRPCEVLHILIPVSRCAKRE